MEIIVTTQEELRRIINDSIIASLHSTPFTQGESAKPIKKYLYGLKELADFLKISVVTAHRLKNSGQIRYIRIGRKMIFDTEEIMEDLRKISFRFRKITT